MVKSPSHNQIIPNMGVAIVPFNFLIVIEFI